MYWLCLQEWLHGNFLFGLVLPRDNTLGEHLDNTLAIRLQYPGSTLAIPRQSLDVWNQSTVVTSLQHQQCMGSYKLLPGMHADCVRGASPFVGQLDSQEAGSVQARHKHEL